MKLTSVIISGGGTGGHIFPAVSIANEIKHQFPEVDILFIGALGRMEMEKVPASGYPIVGLPIKGLDRKNPFKNIQVVFLLLKSLWLAYQTLKEKRPQIAIGVGGYASGPTLWVAQRMGIPTLIQEQNSFAGVTNKLLAKRAGAICVAYPDMERFFPKEKIQITGNPVRNDLFAPIDRSVAFSFFGLQPHKKTILIVGGSLGARTLNEALLESRKAIRANDEVQVLWQCGGYYKERMEREMSASPVENIVLCPFIYRMDLAYAVADVVVSRAGAGTISELAILGKPTLLVPSPNVSEDHQTQNALALFKEGATLIVKDREAQSDLFSTLFDLLGNPSRMKTLGENILKFKKERAAAEIVAKIGEIV